MALLITAKAVTVVITSLIGFAGGHMIYLQLNENTPLSASGISPALIALAGYFLLSTALSVPTLRQLGNLRFAVAVGLILIGPMLLVWL
jgi:zinc transporter ZupT